MGTALAILAGVAVIALAIRGLFASTTGRPVQPRRADSTDDGGLPFLYTDSGGGDSRNDAECADTGGGAGCSDPGGGDSGGDGGGSDAGGGGD